MEEKRHPSPADVADALVKQYYVILYYCPEKLHKFYKESSQLGWPGVDGVVTPVTTLSGIDEKIMASDYKYCFTKVETKVAQESLEGRIIVYVTGFLIRNDVKFRFGQTFLLATQENGFFILNDILRIFYVSDYEGPAPLNFKSLIQSGKVEEASDISPKTLTLSSKVVPKSPKGGQTLPSIGVNSNAKGIYIRYLPYDITKEGIVEVVKQFGPVPRYTKTVQIMRRLDGFCCGFVEFESAESALRAVQARHVMFGEKEVYISYKNRYIKRK